MTNEESYELLIAAGVPEERIDARAIETASVIGDAVIQIAARYLAVHVVENYLSEEQRKIRATIQ